MSREFASRIFHQPLENSHVPQLGGAGSVRVLNRNSRATSPKVGRWPARSFFTIPLTCSERDFEPAVGSVRTPAAVRPGRGVRRCCQESRSTSFFIEDNLTTHVEFHGTLKIQTLTFFFEIPDGWNSTRLGWTLRPVPRRPMATIRAKLTKYPRRLFWSASVRS